MQTVLLIVALSMDVFLASVACGAEQIRIEKKTALCIGAVCSGVLFFSLVCGKLIDGVVREKYAAYLCFAGLFLVGAYKLTEYGIRAYIRRHHFLCKQVKMKFSQLNFIISIYNNPAAADRDCSATMSVTEGICFALAMSVDGFFGGLGAAFLDISIAGTVCLEALSGNMRRTGAKEITPGSAAPCLWCWHSARFCRFIVNVSKKACVFIAVWYNMPIHEAVETHSSCKI